MQPGIAGGLYDGLGVFNHYRVRRPEPVTKALPAETVA